jgi:hypothetical protein
MEMVKRQLPVFLSPEEFEAKAIELASASNQIEVLLGEKKDAAADYKLRIDRLTAERNRLADIVERKAEVREVECEERLNMDRKMVEIYRTDTGEFVESRGILPKDIQQGLRFSHDEVDEDD